MQVSLVRLMIWSGLLGVGMALAFVSANAHEGATGIVKQRMDTMRALKNDVKTIGDMLDGKKYLSYKRLEHLLGKIKASSGEAMTIQFPKNSNAKPSEAEPSIWTSWDDFRGMAGSLETLTGHLMENARLKVAKTQLNADYRKLRAACKTCHERFRQ